MYKDILFRLSDRDRSKRPEKWRTNSGFLIHNNAPAHRLILVKNFLARNNVTTLEHPRFSPDLAPTGFYPFRQFKSVLKERRFCDATNIIKNATEGLKMLSQNVFQEYFQDLCSSWQNCIVTQGAILKEM